MDSSLTFSFRSFGSNFLDTRLFTEDLLVVSGESSCLRFASNGDIYCTVSGDLLRYIARLGFIEYYTRGFEVQSAVSVPRNRWRAESLADIFVDRDASLLLVDVPAGDFPSER